ncbi:MAG: hypothetical protein GDA46_01015 [Bdellovibrionales bacterium]|nr:hypothetical protein [Bdellovibrionales bacterium]
MFFLLVLYFGYSQALEVNSSDFYLCLHKTATEVKSRNIRIQKSQKDNKCSVFYSVNGQDKIISSGKWMNFCKKKVQQVITNLKKGLWECKKQNKIQIFYPFQEKNI